MKLFHSDQFPIPLPPGHRFPMAKYAMLRERVAADGLDGLAEFAIPRAATDAELASAHAPEYVQRVVAGELTPEEIRRIGFPWSEALVERSRRSVGGTIGACRAALADGVGVNLAGGTHHASRAAGEGFCVFNDMAVAARALQAEVPGLQVLVVDCDVHQGNGTAEIFADDPTVFTFSIHAERNYPFRKFPSDLDVPLEDRADDATYLAALETGLGQAFARFPADLVLYVAGADPHVGDALGRLAVSTEGLAQRDRLVLEACHAADAPVAVVLGGGYGRRLDDTVEVHFQTVRIAAEVQRRYGRAPVAG
jgi:acetoin utilization deacetylase AcuC-like enzyme